MPDLDSETEMITVVCPTPDGGRSFLIPKLDHGSPNKIRSLGDLEATISEVPEKIGRALLHFGLLVLDVGDRVKASVKK